MSHPLPRLFATSAAFLAALGLSLAAAAAGSTVTRSSGPLIAQGANGSVRVLSAASALRAGDMLTSGGATYAEIALGGGGTVTLQPDTQVRFDDRRLALMRGGVHVASGNSAVVIETADGNVDMRNATALVVYAPAQPGAVARAYPIHLASLAVMSDAIVEPLRLAQNMPPKPPGLPAGLYVSVIDGAINLSNKGGAATFSAGQFGYTASMIKPPVVVPANPGLKFTPPPTFSSSASSGVPGSGNRAAAVDCEVR
jgi:hypothetical protein